MDEGEVAELVAKTLQWAANRCEGISALQDIVGLDIGEVEFSTLDGARFRLSVSRIQEGE